MRGIADHFVPALPFIGTIFARGGMVGGSRGNVRALLEAGELLMIFLRERPGLSNHSLSDINFRSFVLVMLNLRIRHQVPVIPVGIMGAEEQLPSFFSAEGLVPYVWY